MQKKALTFFLFLFSSSIFLYSQQMLTGKITTSDDPLGIPGVNVLIKGTSTGTVTDLSGNYKIEVPSDTCTLIFSFVGYNTEAVPVRGKSVVNLDLVPTMESIEEIIVTALGIKREEKALGYSVQKVSGQTRYFSSHCL